MPPAGLLPVRFLFVGDVRRISVLACVLLVTLRLFIGWQFLYEGLWKINSLDTPHPWTAEGYLRNAQGPLRETFRNMTGDPDDLGWLDYDRVAARWTDWYNRFQKHHPDLSDQQKLALYSYLFGPPEFAVRLDQLPEGVGEELAKIKAVTYEPKTKQLKVDGKQHLLPQERDRLLNAVREADSDAAKRFRRAVQDLYRRSSQLSQTEKLAVLLKADPERVGQVWTAKGGEVVEQRMGQIDYYKELLKRYEKNLHNAHTAFQWDHLNRQWEEIQELRQELVGPVKALDAELRRYGNELLTSEQLARGPVPEKLTKIDTINLQTMWGLTVLGVLLIAGFVTRVAAVGGAVMLLMFYLAVPPWPGVPEPPGTTEHSLIVNKNLIEVVALLAIAAMPTGRWFGLDSIFYWLFTRLRKKTP